VQRSATPSISTSTSTRWHSTACTECPEACASSLPPPTDAEIDAWCAAWLAACYDCSSGAGAGGDARRSGLDDSALPGLPPLVRAASRPAPAPANASASAPDRRRRSARDPHAPLRQRGRGKPARGRRGPARIGAVWALVSLRGPPPSRASASPRRTTGGCSTA
jgi:hypothetical protein